MLQLGRKLLQLGPSSIARFASLTAGAVALAGCATIGLGPPPPPPAPTAMQTLEYYPFQVKGYQNSYPHKTILILMPTDGRDLAADGVTDTAPLNGNPEIGVMLDQTGAVSQRLYSVPLGPIVQKAIARSAEEAGLTSGISDQSAYQKGVKNPNAYVLECKIRRLWVKKVRGADGQFGPVFRTVAEVSLDLTIYKSPFSVPFWTGNSKDVYYDPPVGSFGLGPEDEAGIYEDPGQVLSVAMTRAVAGIFQHPDFRNLVLGDDIHSR
jgi:hypothetical protein